MYVLFGNKNKNWWQIYLDEEVSEYLGEDTKVSKMDILSFVLFFCVSVTSGKVSLYLSSDQTESLYGIKTTGLFYITEGVVNKYAMNFQHQV